jgi:hypothetical protein
MDPTAHFNDPFALEELMVAAVSICVYIAPVISTELEWALLTSIT